MSSSQFDPDQTSEIAGKSAAVDDLVLATVNAPYTRCINAAMLADSIAKVEIDDWLVHIANFFTSVRPELVIEFAASHGISEDSVARAYVAASHATGMRNPDLESALAPMANPAR
jgi:hypothetical protein